LLTSPPMLWIAGSSYCISHVSVDFGIRFNENKVGTVEF